MCDRFIGYLNIMISRLKIVEESSTTRSLTIQHMTMCVAMSALASQTDLGKSGSCALGLGLVNLKLSPKPGHCTLPH